MNGFRGVQAAAVTPRGKKGDLDFGAAFELIDHLSRGGVDGLVLFAAEGEYPAFTADERKRLCKLAVKRSQIPVIAGVGSTSLDESAALAREAQDAGADALLLPPPHFFHYDQEDIRAFYWQFTHEVLPEVPILLYQTAGASWIAPETAAELLACERFTGLVHATGEVGTYRDFSGAGPLWGDDAVLAEHCVDGVLSAAACAVPEVVVGLFRGLACREHLRELLDWAARFPHPTLWKAATELRGLKTGAIAAALSPRKQRELDEFREWFRAWLPQVRKLTANA